MAGPAARYFVPDPSKGAEIRWQRPADRRLGELRVVAKVVPDAAGAFRWTLRAEGVPAEWSVWQVRFPQLAVADLGPQAKVLLPRGAGELQQDPWQRSFQYRGTYPSGWTSMQLLAAYDDDGKAGLYVAMHDPLGSTKDILVESRPAERAVTLAFEHPAANMGVGGNGFELSGEAVWQLLHGDWFDAAVIYRDWVRRSRPLVSAARARGPCRHAPVDARAFGLGPDRRGAGRVCQPRSRSSRSTSGCRSAFTGTVGTRFPSTTTIPTTSRPSRGSPRRSATSRRRACT